MGKFDGVLICTDLDGTLYSSDRTISNENKEAIDYFKREGGCFTFITGRMPYYSMSAFEAVSPNVAFGCINGGGLFDGHKREYIWKTEIPSDAMDIVKYIDQKVPTVGIQLCGFDMVCNAKQNVATDHYRRVTGHSGVTCHYSEFHKPLGKIIFCSDLEDDIQSVRDALSKNPISDRFDYIRTERILFEMLPKGVNKGLALKTLAEHLNVKISHTIAIGDYDNDVAMLRAAGVGVAVANSSKAALEASDYTTVSNDENALAAVIRDLEAGKYGI